MFLRGFERDDAKTSGFFKLQKIRTDKNIVLNFYFSQILDIKQILEYYRNIEI